MQPGRVVAGKYRLNRVLGMGGMATVWSATNVFTDRAFAIKFLLPSMGQDAGRRLLMEAKASARINHPNIIEIIDVGQAEDGSFFLVMELLTGLSLEAVIVRQEPRMRLYDFFTIMLDVARAMSAAHQNGVIHRDLKPTNIFLHQDRQGVVTKLLDFGISKFLLNDEAAVESLTLTGTILGSPMYMSPEQAQGMRGIDGRTDIFAFGTILFEALCGYRCFEAPNFNALLLTVATKTPRSIDACAPHLPEPLRELVRGCLVVDRKRRFATFDEVVARLEQILPLLERDPVCIAAPLLGATGDEGARRSGVTPTPRPRGATTRAARRMGNYVVGLCAMVVMLLAVLAYAAWRHPPRPKVAAASVQTAVIDNVVTAAPSALPGAAPQAGPEGSAASASSLIAPMDRYGMSPPVVSVDSLPSAERSTPRSPRRSSSRAKDAKESKESKEPDKKTTGQLQISATNQTCTVYVDDNPRGTTPLSVDLAPGAHRLRCESDGSEPKMADVTITEGSTTIYTFRAD